jgi:hypothetical protein
MSRFLVGALLLLAVAGTGLAPVASVSATTVQGTVVQIAGVDDLNATVDHQARRGVGKILAIVVGLAGLGAAAAGYVGSGLTVAGVSVAAGFIPGMVSSSFDSAPAATGMLTTPGLLDAWWAPALASLYWPLLGLRLLQDPVFLLCLGVALVLLRRQPRLVVHP